MMTRTKETGGAIVRTLMIIVGILLCIAGLLALKAGQPFGAVISIIGVVVDIIAFAKKS